MKLTPEMIAHAAPVQFYSRLSDGLAAVSFLVNGSYLDIVFLDGYPIYYSDLMKVIGRWFDSRFVISSEVLPNINYLMDAFAVSRRLRRTDEHFNKVEDTGFDSDRYGTNLANLSMDLVWETLIKIRYVQDEGDFRKFLKELVEEVTKARDGAFVVS